MSGFWAVMISIISGGVWVRILFVFSMWRRVQSPSSSAPWANASPMSVFSWSQKMAIFSLGAASSTFSSAFFAASCGFILFLCLVWVCCIVWGVCG